MTPIEELAHFSDVPIDIEVELGRNIMTVRDVLGLDVNSIIRMPRSAGDNIDMLVGGALIGFGEIVVIENALGVRITHFSQD